MIPKKSIEQFEGIARELKSFYPIMENLKHFMLNTKPEPISTLIWHKTGRLL